MLFEDIKNITSLPEYKEYIKALKDENKEAEKRSFEKLIDKIENAKGKKIYYKALEIEKKPIKKAWEKETIESNKVYNKYKKTLDKAIKSRNYEEYFKNSQKQKEELEEVWGKYKPSDKDINKAKEEGSAKKTKYLSKFNREQITKNFIEKMNKKGKQSGEESEARKKLYEKYYEDDKTFQNTYKKLEEVSGKKFNFKLFDKYKITYYFELYHSIKFNSKKVYFGAVWWEINNNESLEESEWQKIDKYLRKNIFNIFCEKVYLNKKNLDSDAETPDHNGCFIEYTIPREDWEKIDPRLAASEDANYTKSKKYDKYYKERYKELLGKL